VKKLLPNVFELQRKNARDAWCYLVGHCDPAWWSNRLQTRGNVDVVAVDSSSGK
jgi:hypothetical protein